MFQMSLIHFFLDFEFIVVFDSPADNSEITTKLKFVA